MCLKHVVIRTFNVLTYYQHGLRHRVGHPAIIWDDGDLYWLQYDKLHRTDGPANVFKKSNRYCINGVSYTAQEYKYEFKIRNISN